MNLRQLRSSQGAAWAGPLLIFMAFMGLVGLLTALIVVRTAFANTDSIERKRKDG